MLSQPLTFELIDYVSNPFHLKIIRALGILRHGCCVNQTTTMRAHSLSAILGYLTWRETIMVLYSCKTGFVGNESCFSLAK